MRHEQKLMPFAVERPLDTLRDVYCFHSSTRKRDSRIDLKVAIFIDHDRSHNIGHQNRSLNLVSFDFVSQSRWRPRSPRLRRMDDEFTWKLFAKRLPFSGKPPTGCAVND